MSAERKQQRTETAVKEVDVDLSSAPPEPEREKPFTKPFQMSYTNDAKMALKQKRQRRSKSGTMELAKSPEINALSFAIRYLPGGRTRFLELVKLAAMNGDPASEAWWLVFTDLLPSQQKKANFDDVCAACGIKPSALMAGVVGHGMEAHMDMGNIIAAVLHPQVIAAAGKSALRISGEHAEIAAEDRKQLLQARGFLPVPKGNSIYLQANANASAAAASASEPSVPKFAEDIAALREADLIVEAVPPDEA